VSEKSFFNTNLEDGQCPEVRYCRYKYNTLMDSREISQEMVDCIHVAQYRVHLTRFWQGHASSRIHESRKCLTLLRDYSLVKKDFAS
jgi:hypothetical protein